MTQREPVAVWELPIPPPRKWLVPGLVPEGVTTIFFGPGGVGKSYMVLYLAIQALLGGSFTGGPVRKLRSVLYLDAELDLDEFTRRAWAIARGLGREAIPAGLYYWHLPGPLTNPFVFQEVRKFAAPHELIIVDSLSKAAAGKNMQDVAVITEYMTMLEKLGTVVAVDHPPRENPLWTDASRHPFGSVFKDNLSRSVVEVFAPQAGLLRLSQTKANFSALEQARFLSMSFVGDVVRFKEVKES